MTPSLSGRNLTRAASLVATTLALAAVARAYDIPTSPELDPNSTKPSWISLSAGVSDVDGSAASYQRRHQHEDAGFAGVDAFRYDATVFGDRTLRVDGKAVLSDGEFLLRAVLRDENNGWYVDAGFKESRVFYSGTGGYSPNALWIQPFDDQLMLDRGELWLEAGYGKDAWSFKVRGSHRYRKGQKDSTMWGETIYAGVGTASRKIVPTLLDIDETRNSLALDLAYTGESIEAGGGLRFESIEIDNWATSLRNPGQGNSNPNTGGGQRYQITRQGSDSDLFSGHGYVMSRIGDRLTLSGAASTTKIDTALSGFRRFGPTADTDYIPNFPRATTAHGYEDMHGDTQWKQWVLVGNAAFAASKGWTINGGLRFENQTQDSFTHYIETAGPANNPLEEPFEQEGEREVDELLLTLDASYDGIKHWIFTPYVEWAAGEGSLVENQIEGHSPATVVVIDRDTDYDRDYLKYGVNARWYPTKTFNGAVGVYHKVRDNDYDTVADNTPPTGGNRYPAFIETQEFSTDDVYIKGTFRPVTGFSFTARWDRQRTAIDTTEQGLTGTVRSDLEMDILSGTVTWTATSRVSAQVGFNWVNDDVTTSTVLASALSAPSVGRFQSDYKTYTAVIMIAIDESADLQIDGYKYSADNYRGQQTVSLPYGMKASEEVLGVTYSRKLSADLGFSLRYVMSQYDEPSAGGNLDYDAHMIYGRVQMRF